MERKITLDHSEIIRGVQHAMSTQLRRDGRLGPGLELGLLFYATAPDDLHVVGRVRRGLATVCELTGRKPQLSAIVADLALQRLAEEERRALKPTAEVHFRLVQFTAPGEQIDRFFADVLLYPKES